MDYPPNSFWILIESTTLMAHVLRQNSRQISLDSGRWYCLPDHWRDEAERLEQQVQFNRDARVHLWPKTLATLQTR